LIVEPLDRLIVTDLSKAYYSVNMHRLSWPYLGFRPGSYLVCVQCYCLVLGWLRGCSTGSPGP